MSDFKLPQSVLCVSSGPSYFGILSGTKKDLELKDITRIDFPLIEKGKIDQEGLSHALASLEQKEISLVIADDIFLHHIADYTLTSDINIDEKITETVSEVFKDQADPLHIVNVDLAKTSKIQTVQITALTKENVEAIVKAAQSAKVNVTQVIPASFVVKAFVSVDPSLFILQTPDNFLLTSHYIGVDFADSVPQDDLKKLTTSIKQLKKERPHIQHAYLCTETAKYEDVSSELEDIIPLQQVTIDAISTEKDTPMSLRAMALGLKEVVENDFPLPQFDLGSVKVDATPEKADDVGEVKKESPELAIETNKSDDDIIAKLMDKKPEKKVEEEKDEPEEMTEKVSEKEDTEVLPPPTKPVVVKKEEKESEKDEEETEVEPSKVEVKPVTTITPPKVIAAPVSTATATISPKPAVITPPTVSAATISAPKITPSVTAAKEVDEDSSSEKVDSVKTVSSPIKTTTVSTSTPEKKKRGILSYVMLATGVALIISLIGGGFVISQQALSMNKTGELKTPIAEVTEEPQEEVTPTPEPTPEPVDFSELDVLVVNATTIAGKAGRTASTFKEAGFKSAATGNAKGEYDEGTFIMFADEDLEESLPQIEEETELELELLDYTTDEDAAKKHDVIVILAE